MVQSLKFYLPNCFQSWICQSFILPKFCAVWYIAKLFTLILILGKYCLQPDHRVLSSIRRVFGDKWRHVGYILNLKHTLLNNIEVNTWETEEEAFKMLSVWVESSAECCYCSLISAMEEEGLNNAVKHLKQLISSSMYEVIYKVTT